MEMPAAHRKGVSRLVPAQRPRRRIAPGPTMRWIFVRAISSLPDILAVQKMPKRERPGPWDQLGKRIARTEVGSGDVVTAGALGAGRG